MKRQGFFLGVILIGLGVYFLMDQLNIPVMHKLFTWPTLLLIIGIAFLLQVYVAHDRQSIFPGVILTGLGIHFHGRELFSFWPDHWAIYTLIVGIAFIAQHQRILGILLVVISLLGLFYDGVIGWLSYISEAVGWLVHFWPVLLILLGVYILVKKK
ncbi:LiaI-LiaF-like domain-containing protein [Schinkia sp. CFF1]